VPSTQDEDENEGHSSQSGSSLRGQVRFNEDVGLKRLRILRGHNDRVNACKFIHNGARALSCSGDNTMRIWQLSSGECIKCLSGHKETVNSACVFADESRILSASCDHTLRYWDLTSETTIDCHVEENVPKLLGHTEEVRCLVSLETCDKVLSGSDDGELRLFALNTGKCERILRGHEKPIQRCVVYKNETRALSCSSDGKLIVWDIDEDTLPDQSPDQSPVVDYMSPDAIIRVLQDPLENAVQDCGVFDHGTKAVSCSNVSIIIWNLLEDTGDFSSIKCLVAHSDLVNGCCVDPRNEQRLLSCSNDTTLIVWDLQHVLSHEKTTLEEKDVNTARLIGHSQSVTQCAIYAEGARAVSGSQSGEIWIWDMIDAKCVKKLAGHSSTVYSLRVFDSDSRLLSTGHDNLMSLGWMWLRLYVNVFLCCIIAHIAV
jgi:WD40 repeat protein